MNKPNRFGTCGPVLAPENPICPEKISLRRKYQDRRDEVGVVFLRDPPLPPKTR